MKILEGCTRVFLSSDWSVVFGELEDNTLFFYYVELQCLELICMDGKVKEISFDEGIELEKYCIKEWKKKRLEGLFR
jgi:hypothetical protein